MGMNDATALLRAARCQLAVALATIDEWLDGKPPAAGRVAAGADQVPGFMAEYTSPKRGAAIQARVLYDVYVVWCQRKGVDRLGPRLFGLRLTELGYPKGKAGCNFYLGLEFAQCGGDLLRAARGDGVAVQPASHGPASH